MTETELENMRAKVSRASVLRHQIQSLEELLPILDVKLHGGNPRLDMSQQTVFTDNLMERAPKMVREELWKILQVRKREFEGM